MLEVVNIAKINNVKIFIICAMKFSYETIFIFVDVNPIVKLPFCNDTGYRFNRIICIDYAFAIYALRL